MKDAIRWKKRHTTDNHGHPAVDYLSEPPGLLIWNEYDRRWTVQRYQPGPPERYTPIEGMDFGSIREAKKAAASLFKRESAERVAR